MAIKVYKSSDLGAPTLNGLAGQLLVVLDAVFQNGYGSVGVSSITRTGATATVVTSAPHGLSTGDSATIGGADQADYNIDAVVTVLSSVSFSYAVVNSPVTPATGTITSKRSPAGFTKVYSGTNKAVYRSNDVTGNRRYLRVLDDGGGTGGSQEARLFGYESMTDVDNGTNPFPTAAQSSFGYVLRKSSTTDAVAKTWVIITDGKFVYFMVQHANTSLLMDNTSAPFGALFGDFISYKPGDAWATLITGSSAQAATSSPYNGTIASRSNISAVSSFASSLVAARSFTAVAGARYVGLFGTGLAPNCFGSVAILSYPHLVDNGLYLVPIAVTQDSPSVIRGRLPGAYEGMHGRALNNMDVVEDVQGLPGRKFMCLYGMDGGSAGCIFVDITGPWDS